ncbi:unnamed protein product, partial [Polarella glacialis]
ADAGDVTQGSDCRLPCKRPKGKLTRLRQSDCFLARGQAAVMVPMLQSQLMLWCWPGATSSLLLGQLLTTLRLRRVGLRLSWSHRRLPS